MVGDGRYSSPAGLHTFGDVSLAIDALRAEVASLSAQVASAPAQAQAAAARQIDALRHSSTALAAILGSGTLVLPVATAALDASISASGRVQLLYDEATARVYLEGYVREKGAVVRVELT